MKGSIRIAIIDDNITIRSGLRLLLSRIQDIYITCEAGYAEALRVIADAPEIILLRLEPKESQKILALVNHIRQSNPMIKVLALAYSSSDPLVLRCLKAGVPGCLVKESSLQDLEMAIREVAAGRMYIPVAVTTHMVQDLPEILGSDTQEVPLLPGQQLKVLKLISQGYSNEEIARRLFISKRTVDMHAYRLFKRLNVTSRTQAIQAALQIGLIDIQSPVEELGAL
jgi:DNA-binding NarL/FixJ family response regulator